MWLCNLWGSIILVYLFILLLSVLSPSFDVFFSLFLHFICVLVLNNFYMFYWKPEVRIHNLIPQLELSSFRIPTWTLRWQVRYCFNFPYSLSLQILRTLATSKIRQQYLVSKPANFEVLWGIVINSPRYLTRNAIYLSRINF